jgi:pyruvate dehydrogenase (quinone)
VLFWHNPCKAFIDVLIYLGSIPRSYEVPFTSASDLSQEGRRNMSTTVSDFLIKRLNEWGIRRIFGFPGDGINGIIGAIGRAGDKVDYVQVRHEEMAAFMACAHSKFTGEVGGSSAERTLRCENGPPERGGHRGTASAHGDGRQFSAGDRFGQSIQGRGG